MILESLRAWRDRWKYRGKHSFAQCGEDLIAAFLLQGVLGIDRPAYLDIGTNHPIEFNNTYFFYRQGCRGVCIEPDPLLCDRIERVRKRDICLNVGVGTEAKSRAPFYVLTSRTLSTFSRDEAEHQVQNGSQRIEQVVEIPIVAINHIIEKYSNPPPHYVTLDTEGMDLDILNTFDFSKYRPQVFCVETLSHTTKRKLSEIEKLMQTKGYCTYADTFINTIFVEKSAWSKTGEFGPLRLRFLEQEQM